MDNVIDKFGESVQISNVTPDSFDATASASISGTFLSWVFQYAGQMHILSPGPARRLYEEMLTTALEGARPGAAVKVTEHKWKL